MGSAPATSAEKVPADSRSVPARPECISDLLARPPHRSAVRSPNAATNPPGPAIAGRVEREAVTLPAPDPLKPPDPARLKPLDPGPAKRPDPEPLLPDPEPLLPDPEPLLPAAGPALPDPQPRLPGPEPRRPDREPLLPDRQPRLPDPEPLLPDPEPLLRDPEPAKPAGPAQRRPVGPGLRMIRPCPGRTLGPASGALTSGFP